jgi:hypothetical protein
MDADNSFYVKFIATYAPTFFGYIISVLAILVGDKLFQKKSKMVEYSVLLSASKVKLSLDK